MRFFIACMIFSFPLYSYSGMLWTYDLKGKVTEGEDAANLIKDISIGDNFQIQMNVEFLSDATHNVSFAGNIGGWEFSRQESSGFYYLGDFAPERFLTTGSSSFLNSPEGRDGVGIEAVDIFIELFGFDQTGSHSIPEGERLVKGSGEIDPTKFYSGQISFDFLAILDADFEVGMERNLVGEIDSFTRVTEPGPAVILFLGVLGILAIGKSRKVRHGCQFT